MKIEPPFWVFDKHLKIYQVVCREPKRFFSVLRTFSGSFWELSIVPDVQHCWIFFIDKIQEFLYKRKIEIFKCKIPQILSEESHIPLWWWITWTLCLHHTVQMLNQALAGLEAIQCLIPSKAIKCAEMWSVWQQSSRQRALTHKIRHLPTALCNFNSHISFGNLIQFLFYDSVNWIKHTYLSIHQNTRCSRY